MPTHSVQLPGGTGTASGGQRQFVPALARAAVAVGSTRSSWRSTRIRIAALSDGPNNWPLDRLEPLLRELKAIDEAVKSRSSEA